MDFSRFHFDPRITDNINSCGYAKPTPIQKKAITPIQNGRDVLGLAQTGTGKTAAFVLPILQNLLASGGTTKGARAIVIAPTRELALQIHQSIRDLARNTGLASTVVYGGVGKQPQLSAIRKGVDIIVACPGRLLDILSEKDISLQQVRTLVLDEADHMFDKGFLPDIRRIIGQLPTRRQNLVFSATMPKAVRHLVEEILKNPCRIEINHSQPVAAISHHLIETEKAHKTELLKHLLGRREMHSTVVFTRTKHKAKSLARQLDGAGFRAIAIQGNLSQQKRQQALEGFRTGTFTVLVATDIAARGIDVSAVSHVVNYDIPDTPATYTHRTGRTGRAELTGTAITFADREDRSILLQIEKTLGCTMNRLVIDHTVLIHEKNGSSGQLRKPAQRQNRGPELATPLQRKRSRSKRVAQ